MNWTAIEEIGGVPSTRASAGFAHRAGNLQELVGEAHRYLTTGLGTDFDPVIVVLDQSDWLIGGEEEIPYGVPYATPDYELVIPADYTDNFLVDIYAASGSRTSAERFADLIAVHELGHLHADALGLEFPQGWLSEFLATYLAYCFLATHRPDDASLWFTLSRKCADGTTPQHRSLEELDELYFGVGPENYIWYENILSLRVAEVHADMGLDFALQLRSAGIGPEDDTQKTLAAAEKIHAGFEAWANSLRE